MSDPVRSVSSEVVQIYGTWEGGGSSATTKLRGDGWTIATGAGSGVYTITITGDLPHYELVSFVADLHADAPGDVDTYSAHLDWNASSSSSLVFTLSEAGTPTDLAADEYMSFIAVFKDSAV